MVANGEGVFKKIYTDHVLLKGWKYGPVCRELRNCITPDGIIDNTNDISEESKYIINNIIQEYGCLASWKLSDISHKEISWQNARKGLKDGENGSQKLSLEDIRLDAKKVRPYDHVWDMYYDEFEDAENPAGLVKSFGQYFHFMTLKAQGMRLTKNCYLRTHKQTIVHAASLTSMICDFKSVYPDLYIEALFPGYVFMETQNLERSTIEDLKKVNGFYHFLADNSAPQKLQGSDLTYLLIIPPSETMVK